MFESDKKSPLERLKKGLYSRKDVFADAPRHRVHLEENSVPHTWQTPEAPAPEEVHALKKSRKIYSYFFLGALVFFLGAAAIGGYTLFGGKNFISAANVDIVVAGPNTIGGGEVLALDVTIENRNATDIQLVDLIVEYPEGTKDAVDPSKDLAKVRFEVGDIGSRETAKKAIRAILFGEEGDVREIKLTAEYRTDNSNAIFYKEKEYKVTISSSPVLISVKAPEKALSGQPTDVEITISSNSAVPIKNLLLSLDMPFGLSVASAVPEATYSESVWRIGDLAPGAKRVIKLKLKVDGQDEEERSLRAHVGIASDRNNREIATNIISETHTFLLERPFLGLDVTLNGVRGDLASESDRSIRGEIIWTNNSATKITNARIEARITGNVLDKNSVRVPEGFYDSLNNTIVWEGGRTPGLDSIAPGEDGRVSFNFSTLASIPGQSIANPTVNIVVSAAGSRIDEGGAPQEITAGATRSVKLISNLAVSARALFSQGPFQNSGPIPPKEDEETTYTVVWTVTNTSNNVTGARVTASIPAYVKWRGVVSPVDASISYDPTGGGIVWDIGAVPRNADIGSGAKQVYFQLTLRPSANQVGSVPILVNESIVRGTDVFTGVTIENKAPALTTRTSSDLLFKAGDDVVQD
jgi:hypothetical protein